MDKVTSIVRSINQKKVDGYKYLYDNFYSSLCNFSSKFLKQKDLAEDIVQDVLLKLWKSDAKFNTIIALKAYLFYSVKNASLNAIRNNLKLSDINAPDTEVHSVNTGEKSIEQILIQEEYYRQIYNAIENLSPERKRIILLSMDGYSNQEISDKLNISINTVKSLKLRAYGVLRKELSCPAIFFLIYLTQ